jgi:oxygen-independent coproporphyrinogen III oxidase
MVFNNSTIENIGLYVHIPFCRSKCRYCGFYSELIENHNPDRLISALTAELKSYGFVKSINTVYIGGGSPSCLPTETIVRLIKQITEQWENIEEFTIECNPGQADLQLLKTIRNLGVNRISIGVQSFIQSELEILGRTHSVDCIYKAVETAKTAGFDKISIDLIFAIPGTTIESWRDNLTKAIELGINHISAYSLSYEEGTALKDDVDAGRILRVDEETDRAMYELAIKMLEEAGFEQYEISNFARPGFRCRHNVGYWKNYPFVGVGPAAASHIGNRRTKNIDDINEYIYAIENGEGATAEVVELTGKDVACETAVLNLRMREGINVKRYNETNEVNVNDIFDEPISRYSRLGFIEQKDGRIYLTKNALPIADSILCDFIAD